MDSIAQAQEGCEYPGYQQKNLSPSARNLRLAYPWPGNVRELLNTLRRAALWSKGATIAGEDLREALLLPPAREDDRLLELPKRKLLNCWVCQATKSSKPDGKIGRCGMMA